MSQYDAAVNAIMAGQEITLQDAPPNVLAGIRSCYYRQRSKLAGMGYKNKKILSVQTSPEGVTKLKLIDPPTFEFSVQEKP